MGNVYLISDLHDMHRKIGDYRCTVAPEVTCVEQNREFIRKHWRAKKHDKVFILGDCGFDKKSIKFIKSLIGEKDLIPGNHDFENKTRPTPTEWDTVFNHIRSSYKWKPENHRFILSHIPVHPSSLHEYINIHGHIHTCEKDFMNVNTEHYDPRYINVNMDVLYPRTGEIMISLDELTDYMKGFVL